MTWRYQSGDKYDLYQLLEFKLFFQKDLLSAENELYKAIQYKKYQLPNWRTEIIRRELGVEEAKKNLDTIERVIEEYRNANNI